MARYPISLLNLIAVLKKLPGVGSKTAERFAFHLLSWPEKNLEQLAESARTLKEKIRKCPTCNSLIDEAHCEFCDLTKRDTSSLCIISSPKDVYALEETRSYRGLYHVLGALLSPLDGRMPEHLNLKHLQKRIEELPLKEVIIALDSTIEGDATALYLRENLKKEGVRISRLAFGLPMGSSLDYVDGGTLARALQGRSKF